MESSYLSPCNGNPSNRSVDVDFPEYFQTKLQEKLQFPYTDFPGADGDSSQEGASRRNISIDFTKDYRYPDDNGPNGFDFTRSPRDTEEHQKKHQNPIIEGLQSVKQHVDQQLYSLKVELGMQPTKEDVLIDQQQARMMKEMKEQLGGNRTLSEITEEPSDMNIDNRSSLNPFGQALILPETSKDLEMSSELDSNRCYQKILHDTEGYLLLQNSKTPARESPRHPQSLQGLQQEAMSPIAVPHLQRPEMRNGIQVHRQSSFWNSASASASLMMADAPTQDKHCSSPNFSDCRVQAYLDVHTLDMSSPEMVSQPTRVIKKGKSAIDVVAGNTPQPLKTVDPFSMTVVLETFSVQIPEATMVSDGPERKNSPTQAKMLTPQRKSSPYDPKRPKNGDTSAGRSIHEPKAVMNPANQDFTPTRKAIDRVNSQSPSKKGQHSYTVENPSRASKKDVQKEDRSKVSKASHEDSLGKTMINQSAPSIMKPVVRAMPMRPYKKEGSSNPISQNIKDVIKETIESNLNLDFEKEYTKEKDNISHHLSRISQMLNQFGVGASAAAGTHSVFGNQQTISSTESFTDLGSLQVESEVPSRPEVSKIAASDMVFLASHTQNEVARSLNVIPERHPQDFTSDARTTGSAHQKATQPKDSTITDSRVHSKGKLQATKLQKAASNENYGRNLLGDEHNKNKLLGALRQFQGKVKVSLRPPASINRTPMSLIQRNRAPDLSELDSLYKNSVGENGRALSILTEKPKTSLSRERKLSHNTTTSRGAEMPHQIPGVQLGPRGISNSDAAYKFCKSYNKGDGGYRQSMLEKAHASNARLLYTRPKQFEEKSYTSRGIWENSNGRSVSGSKSTTGNHKDHKQSKGDPLMAGISLANFGQSSAAGTLKRSVWGSYATATPDFRGSSPLPHYDASFGVQIAPKASDSFVLEVGRKSATESMAKSSFKKKASEAKCDTSNTLKVVNIDLKTLCQTTSEVKSKTSEGFFRGTKKFRGETG